MRQTLTKMAVRRSVRKRTINYAVLILENIANGPVNMIQKQKIHIVDVRKNMSGVKMVNLVSKLRNRIT